VCENVEESQPAEKKAGLRLIKNPNKIELDNVESIFSGKDFNYAITKDDAVYSWGLGEFGVLGTATDDTAYTPQKLDEKSFQGKRVNHIGLGSQHVIILASNKGANELELDEEVLKKNEDAGKLSRKGTASSAASGKKEPAGKKGKGKKGEEAVPELAKKEEGEVRKKKKVRGETEMGKKRKDGMDEGKR